MRNTLKSTWKYKRGNWTVSTIEGLEGWETATNRPENGPNTFPAFGYEYKWVVVERYDNQDSAERGHVKWVKLMEENPHRKLEEL